MIVALTCVTAAVLLGWPVRFVGADSPTLAPGARFDIAQPIPVGCVEHTPLDGGSDFVGDYHCAGIALNYHVAGVNLSPSPMWAGQWLFVDERGSFRRGSCTFNRGIHPSINGASWPVAQTFPNDPSGSKGAYLTWRYGSTSDDVTAAGLWAVFHYYAQDAAGTNRAVDPTSPLVPSLDLVAAATGRADVAAMASALDAEAVRFSDPVSIDVQITADGRGEADVMAGSSPVGSITVTLAVEGASFDDGETTMSVPTDAMGAAQFAIDTSSSTNVTVSATIEGPARAQVYRGTPADPSAQFGQTMITSGAPTTLTAQVAATITQAPPITTSQPDAVTTTMPLTTMPLITVPPTTMPPTTGPLTTEPAVEQSVEPFTDPSATTAPPSVAIPETVQSLVVSAPEVSAPADVVDRPLPITGRTAIGISYWATAMVVAGFGIVGALRRRRVDA